jgi:hypothetical protein
MAEMILPGTYIDVRAEKLITPGPVSTGNIGIVGTASRGRLADATDATTVYTPANIGEARQIFGPADDYENPLESDPATGEKFPLTLIRAMELAFNNGAQRVFAVRVAGAGQAVADYALGAVTFTALGPGTGYNGFTISAVDNSGLLNVTIKLGSLIETWRDVPTPADEFAQVINGTHPGYPYGSKASTGGGSTLFRAVNAGNAAIAPGDAVQGAVGANGANTGAGAAYEDGLNALLNQDVQIVVLAGQDATQLGSMLSGHVNNASNDLNKRERIGVIGTNTAVLANLIANNEDNPEGRLVYVGPGVRAIDSASSREVVLPGTYTAAAVAGLISSLDPHFSPTNKTIVANGVQQNFNGTELEQLVLNRVFAIEDRAGALRVVRGITSSTNSAWQQVTTRRIVDFARKGVRSAADPFIGKLNNARVRGAMHGSINSLLADMVDREMLVSYELEVTATREQEIRGIAQVNMVLRPTFSIDYIRVVMYLE